MSANALELPSIEQFDLKRRFSLVRETTLRLTAGFSAEDQILQSMPDASPVKWHLAHTTWFFENFILEPLSNYTAFDSRYKYLFNSYYKQIAGGHPMRGSRGLLSRPSLERIHAYREYVDAAILAALDSASNGTLGLVELGLNHEQQHQELILTDSKHALWSSPLSPEVSLASRCDVASTTQPLTWVEVEGGLQKIGHDGEGFAFDNEGPRHEVWLRPFRIASRPVTNGEYLEFMLDGGYRRPDLWLSDGWDTVCAQGWNAPLYWEERDGYWLEFTAAGLSAVDAADPVCHISYYEADAYARWRCVRLPTESEWEVVAGPEPIRGCFLEEGIFHPQPARAPGMQQILGDVWEWTASPYVSYPGFQPAAGALGEYNGKFMCNQFVLRGGSCATPASHIRVTYRNFFPPHARWQFSGIRLAEDIA